MRRGEEISLGLEFASPSASNDGSQYMRNHFPVKQQKLSFIFSYFQSFLVAHKCLNFHPS